MIWQTKNQPSDTQSLCLQYAILVIVDYLNVMQAGRDWQVLCFSKKRRSKRMGSCWQSICGKGRIVHKILITGCILLICYLGVPIKVCPCYVRALSRNCQAWLARCAKRLLPRIRKTASSVLEFCNLHNNRIIDSYGDKLLGNRFVHVRADLVVHEYSCAVVCYQISPPSIFCVLQDTLRAKEAWI